MSTTPSKHNVTITSFSYKTGQPSTALKTYTHDLRKRVRNPYRVVALRKLTGKSPEVQNYILRCPKSRQVIDLVVAYLNAGHNVNVGCTGGIHRSVAVAELAAIEARKYGHTVQVVHRDLKEE